MINIQTEQKPYEISFILDETLNEEKLFDENQKVKILISDLGGVFQKETFPKKRNLAYPIKKQLMGHFANIYFYLMPKNLKDLEKKLKFEKNILRYLIIEVDKKQFKEIAKIKEIGKDKFKKMTKEIGPEDKAQIEELDKKLGEILKKI